MEKEDTPVLHVYCNFQNHQSEVTAPILTSLLKQAVSWLDFIPEVIDQKAKESFRGRGLSVPKILRLLQAATLRPHKRTFLCVDALDECGTEGLPEFLRLHSIVTGSPNIRLFATERPHIQARLVEHFGGALEIIHLNRRRRISEDIFT